MLEAGSALDVTRNAAGNASFIEVLDRVLDKGIVIEGFVNVSVAGLDLMKFEGWVVVSSIQTYLRYTDSFGTEARGTEARLPIETDRTESTIPARPFPETWR